MSELLRPGEAAERLGVTPRSLIRMAQRGEIVAVTLPSGHHRYLFGRLTDAERAAGVAAVAGLAPQPAPTADAVERAVVAEALRNAADIIETTGPDHSEDVREGIEYAVSWLRDEAGHETAAARAGEAEPIEADRCDSHPDPTTRTWGAYRTGATALTVQTSTGEHVTDSDADWVARTLNAAQRAGEAVVEWWGRSQRSRKYVPHAFTADGPALAETALCGEPRDGMNYLGRVAPEVGGCSACLAAQRGGEAADREALVKAGTDLACEHLGYADMGVRVLVERITDAALAARGDAAPTVTAEQVREAGRRAIDALLALHESGEGFTGEESWDIVGRAALGIEVTP